MLAPAREAWSFGTTHLGPLVVVNGEAYGRAVDECGHDLLCPRCRCSVVRLIEEASGTITRVCADCDLEVGGAADIKGDIVELRAAIAWSMFSHGPVCGRRCHGCVECAFAAEVRS